MNYDVFFLSHGEANAEENWERLRSIAVWAKRVRDVSGIREAHLTAAKKAKTLMFYVVDADCWVDDFSFRYKPDHSQIGMTHIWYARNPVNDLEYGYGGIKLFPTKRTLESKSNAIDFSTSVSSLVIHPEVTSTTKFNVDALSAWRAGFRECAKLAAAIIPGENQEETIKRLDAWCTKGGNRPFGMETINGSLYGKTYGELFRDNPDKLAKINDRECLAKTYLNL